MARDASEKVAVRNAYIAQGLSLEMAAQQAGVPFSTARKWKSADRDAGDDWDKQRTAQMLAGGDIEAVKRAMLALGIRQFHALLELLPSLPPETQLERAPALVDALNKLYNLSKGLMPDVDELAIRLDTLKRLAEFVRVRFPQSAAGLLEALEAFGREVA